MKCKVLHSAIREGCNLQIVETLVNAGSSVNAQAENGFTPLIDAIRSSPNGYLDVVGNSSVRQMFWLIFVQNC